MDLSPPPLWPLLHQIQLLMLNSPIDALPLDAMVQIICKLNHHELKPVINVSKFFHEAVCVARQWHFDFSTPEPKTGRSSREFNETPEAPLMKQSKKSRKVRLSEEETQKIAVVLFPATDCKTEVSSKFKSHHQTQRISQANA